MYFICKSNLINSCFNVIDIFLLLFTFFFSSQQEEAPKKAKKCRPRQKLFDQQAVRDLGLTVGRDGDFFVFKNNLYSHRGFLYKEVTITSLVLKGVVPTLDELKMFQETQEIEDDTILQVEPEEELSIHPGDIVEVVKNELANLRGKVTAVNNITRLVTMLPQHKDLEVRCLVTCHSSRTCGVLYKCMKCNS
jgi:transcription elongation factor